MEKLSKIKLHDAVVLENQEMKMISGGSGGSGGGWCCFSDGECILTGCTTTSQCTSLYGEGTCK